MRYRRPSDDKLWSSHCPWRQAPGRRRNRGREPKRSRTLRGPRWHHAAAFLRPVGLRENSLDARFLGADGPGADGPLFSVLVCRCASSVASRVRGLGRVELLVGRWGVSMLVYIYFRHWQIVYYSKKSDTTQYSYASASSARTARRPRLSRRPLETAPLSTAPRPPRRRACTTCPACTPRLTCR